MPDWPQEIRSLLAGSRLEPTREAEIVDELAQHLNDPCDDALMSGLSPEEAERVAISPWKNGSLGASLRPVERVSHPAPAPARIRERTSWPAYGMSCGLVGVFSG